MRYPALPCLVLVALLAAACAARVERRFEDGTVARTGELSSGRQTGLWTYHHPSGGKQSEGHFEDDERVGTWTYWYEDGTREMEGAFADEARVGIWSFWHPNGQVRARGRFDIGLEAGEWSFFDASGALERRGDFDEGQPALRWTFFRPDGATRAAGHFLRGERVGTWLWRDADGKETQTSYAFPPGAVLVEERLGPGGLRRHGFLVEGAQSGRWVSHHPNGARRIEARFEQGVLRGPALAWRESGELLAQCQLENGCIVGDWRIAASGAPQLARLPQARPRGVFGGEWSDDSLAEAMPAHVVVEAWLAELCAPIEAQALATERVPAARAPDPADTALADAPPEIPANAQPWTEREERAIADLVQMYGPGLPLGDWEYGAPAPDPARSGSRPDGGRPREVTGQPLPITRFVCADGGVFDLADLRGKRQVLVTILRGFGGQVCVYCATQTKALAKAAAEFQSRDTEVVVVYPGPKGGLRAFLEAYERTFGAGDRPPYRLLYDADLALTKALGIQDNIAIPTSLVLDRAGIVRWSHVAQHIADRPSVKDLLATLERLDRSGK